MSKIMIYTQWNSPRNSVMYMRSVAKVLEQNNEILIINKSPELSARQEFDNIGTIHNDMSDTEFKEFITEHKPNVCIFNSYNTYSTEGIKHEICRDMNVTTIQYVPSNKLLLDSLRFDKLLVPSISYKRNIVRQGIMNFVYLPYTIDPEEYKLEPRPKTDERIVYLHLKGLDKDNNNDIKFLEDNWLDIKNDNEELVIVEKNGYVMSRHDILKYIKSADCLIQPYKKTEDICSTIIEGLACGTPVITSDTEPMSDFVLERKNGFNINMNLSMQDKAKDYRRVMNLINIKMIKDSLSNNALLSSKNFDQANFKELLK